MDFHALLKASFRHNLNYDFYALQEARHIAALVGSVGRMSQKHIVKVGPESVTAVANILKISAISSAGYKAGQNGNAVYEFFRSIFYCAETNRVYP